MEVGLTSMPICCFSFSCYFGGRNDAYNGHKTMQLHVLPRLIKAKIVSINFGMWMSRLGVDTFALVINYLNDYWIPQHVTIDLFKVHESTRLSMVGQLHFLLEKYNLMHHMITFVKDASINLTFMTTTLSSIVDCHPLKL
jgi:hypothetical protein